ncbi:MAG: hypothetical protein ACRDRW_06430 [Pseudonocardiaceae bacterium]
MTTTARHRRPTPAGWLPVIVSAILGAALGAGAVALASPSPSPSAQQVTTQQAPSNTASSNTAPRPAEIVRLADPAAFAAPATDAAGMAVTVLRPEKVKGGVRLTIALANTSDIPITVDTGALGPHDPRFNDAIVPISMTPVRKKLVPGEGYTYQCVIKLPTMNAGRLAFVVGPVSVAGQAAGD